MRVLNARGVAVMPTDTIYGIVSSALDPEVVARVYHLRQRDLKKPMIILIGRSEDVREFGVRLPPKLRMMLDEYWPGKVSIVMPMANKFAQFKYLHRGTKALAFRVPKLKWLRELLKKTGPLVAPSANIQGMPPALTIRAAKKYVGKDVDLYADGGRRESKPSTLLKVDVRGAIELLRK